MDHVITIAETEFNLIKTGRDQAEQVIAIGKWLSQYGLPALQMLADEDGTVNIDSGFELIGAIIELLTPDALIDLFALVVGCSGNFANKHFAIDILIEAVELLYGSQPAFQKIIARFFSPTTSTTDTEE
jgi:hypothetical protein